MYSEAIYTTNLYLSILLMFCFWRCCIIIQ